MHRAYNGAASCLKYQCPLYDTVQNLGHSEVQSYFAAWTQVLAATLKRSGFDTKAARETAENVVAGIQGALVLARTQDDPSVFTRAMKRSQQRTRSACLV
jgi:hypothetical protein